MPPAWMRAFPLPSRQSRLIIELPAAAGCTTSFSLQRPQGTWRWALVCPPYLAAKAQTHLIRQCAMELLDAISGTRNECFYWVTASTPMNNCVAICTDNYKIF